MSSSVHVTAGTIAALIAVGLHACSKPKVEIPVADLVGPYRLDVDGRSDQLVLLADGTYHYTEDPAGAARSQQGTWTAIHGARTNTGTLLSLEHFRWDWTPIRDKPGWHSNQYVSLNLDVEIVAGNPRITLSPDQGLYLERE
jgi:hypothetical protein